MDIIVFVLLGVVAVLILIVGILFVAGAINSKERKHALWILLATVGGMIWSIFSGILFANTIHNDVVAASTMYFVSLGALMAGVGLLGYCVPNNRAGKRAILILSILSLVLMAVGCAQSQQTLLEPLFGGLNWFYICFSVLTAIVFVCAIIGAWQRVSAVTEKRAKDAAMLFLIGLTATTIIALIFNMALPFGAKIFTFLWIGPIANYILALTFYFSLFVNHQISLQSNWLKIISYAVIVCSAVMVYAVAVYFIATAIFNIGSDAIHIFAFATIISTILLVLIALVYKSTASVRSLLLNHVDLAYVINRINKMPIHNNYAQIATFLADHLHISFIGIIINNRLYKSDEIDIPAHDLKAITTLKTESQTIWQKPKLELSYALLELNLSGVAQLRTDTANIMGQVLVGRPTGKVNLSRRDFVIIEMILNLLAERMQSNSKR